MMKRREFIKAGTLLTFLLLQSKAKAAEIISEINSSADKFIKLIAEIIMSLRKEGSNIVKKIMNGRKYKFDPYSHYPTDEGIKDEVSGCQLFFHIHRPNEYGHFHTFALDENGELVHLILISMSEDGKPIALATVNRWVTGDKYVKADILKKLADNFYVAPSLFHDKRIIEFVNYIFKSYRDEIFELFDKRDEWIKNYVNENFREPFEDRDYEILSYRKIDL
ncbi:MAG: hypothetical protein QHH13_02240 [Melioribacter sp.]|uniref:DUF6969 family protein n=1 Tax=Rosettibacter primus TaxID=3111523 RepID=UPI00247C22DA|nr:hypothetical protein [Melioribacter sp.]